MRKWLIRVFVAVSAMIVLAFAAPLAVLIRTTAEDRAMDTARADAAAVVPALVSGGSQAQLESAVGATFNGAAGRMTLVTFEGETIGMLTEESQRLTEALATGMSGLGDVSGGKEVVTAIANGSGQIAAIRVFVPTGDLRQGQWAAWAALGAVAALLTGLSVLIADRLARTVVQPTIDLAAAADKLGSGDLEARVTPDGPPELTGLGESFNRLGSRISEMMARERELLAELSHRLRTPLTPLRMKIDRVQDAGLADDMRSDIDDLTLIINDLIEEARRGARHTFGATCDAADLVAERVEFWTVLAEDQGRECNFDRPTEAAIVAVDEVELAAAVDVLLENVFSHTEEGVPLTVRVRIDDETGEVRIGVADGGPGFDSRLILPGESGGTSTGLGLHIARRSAERAGGRLELSDSDLGGVLLTLVLPLRAQT